MPQTESPNFRPLLALGPKFGLGQVNLFLKQAIIKVWGGGRKIPVLFLEFISMSSLKIEQSEKCQNVCPQSLDRFKK